MQIRLFPIAFFTRTAATVESTPPLRAQITFELPVVIFILSIFGINKVMRSPVPFALTDFQIKNYQEFSSLLQYGQPPGGTERQRY